MDELINYFRELNAEFIEEESLVEDVEVPEIMCKFYEKIKYVNLPYGRIYNLETALDNSKRLPFSPEWFVFGQDNYYSYWICFKRKTITGCYFTYWDHESGCSMEEPVWKDLLSFLKEVEEDANEGW